MTPPNKNREEANRIRDEWAKATAPYEWEGVYQATEPLVASFTTALDGKDEEIKHQKERLAFPCVDCAEKDREIENWREEARRYASNVDHANGKIEKLDSLLRKVVGALEIRSGYHANCKIKTFSDKICTCGDVEARKLLSLPELQMYREVKRG